MLDKKQRIIFLIDCESFYASVEKAKRPELRKQPVVVAGSPERRSGIVLAACPIAKSHGVKTAESIGESLAKCPGLVIIKPRMQTYIDVSMAITEMYQSYTDLVEPYSIDEQFLDVTGSLHLYDCSPNELAKRIQERIRIATGVHTRVGIGANKILAKTATDNYAKKNESGIYELKKEELADTLWTLPVDKMFMVGNKMTRHFKYMGMHTIGDVAKTPLIDLMRKMRLKFGKNSDINAELYWRIANGIDNSPVTPGTHSEAPKSIGHSMTLPRNYAKLEEIKVILLEMTELVCQRCRRLGVMGGVVSVGCMGADYDHLTGFNRQMTIDPTNVTNQIYRAATELLLQHWDGEPVRSIGVSVSKFSSDDGYQLSLFDLGRERSMALERATDAIKARYGETSILRAVSYTEAGQAKDRSSKIGGHFK